MKKAILATKVGMTQIFNEDGMLIPVTVLQAGPCVVTQVKTEENDGYTSVQVGFGEIREKLVNKPEKGHFDKAGVAVKRFVKEFRFDNAGEYEVGQEIKADIFAAGDHIDATAVSKGKKENNRNFLRLNFTASHEHSVTVKILNSYNISFKGDTYADRHKSVPKRIKKTWQ